MRIKINGQDIDQRIDRVSISDDEWSDFAGWCVIIIGAIACRWWYLLWV